MNDDYSSKTSKRYGSSFDMILDRYIEKNRVLSATIELTKKCNLRCKHCYIDEYTDEGMSYDTICKIIDQLHDLGVYHITLTGGEILTIKDIKSIIRYIRQRHIGLDLFTNLTLLTQDVALFISQYYVSNVSTTIFSLSPQTHDSITGEEGSLEKVLRNIELLKQMGVRLEVKMPVMNLNADSIADVEKYCKDNGISFLTGYYLFPKESGNMLTKEYCMSDSDVRKHIYHMDIVNGNVYPSPRGEYLCSALLTGLSICSNGELYPCGSIMKCMGNVLDDELAAIWDSKIYYDIRHTIAPADFVCNSCDFNEYCDFCPAAAYIETGSYYKCIPQNYQVAKIRSEVYSSEKG